MPSIPLRPRPLTDERPPPVSARTARGRHPARGRARAALLLAASGLVLTGCIGPDEQQTDTSQQDTAAALVQPEAVATDATSAMGGSLFEIGPRESVYLVSTEAGEAGLARRVVSGIGADGTWTVEIERGPQGGLDLVRRLTLRRGEIGPLLVSLETRDDRSGDWVRYAFEPPLPAEPEKGPTSGSVSADGGPAPEGDAEITLARRDDRVTWTLGMKLGPARVVRARTLHPDGIEKATLAVRVFGLRVRGSDERWEPVETDASP